MRVQQYPVGQDTDWLDYVPTITQGVGVSATISARYRRIGNMVDVMIKATCSSTGTAATTVLITLPVAAAQGSLTDIGGGLFFDNSASKRYNVTCEVSTSTTFNMIDDINNTSLGASVITLGSSDVFRLSLRYEAAANTGFEIP